MLCTLCVKEVFLATVSLWKPFWTNKLIKNELDLYLPIADLL